MIKHALILSVGVIASSLSFSALGSENPKALSEDILRLTKQLEALQKRLDAYEEQATAVKQAPAAVAVEVQPEQKPESAKPELSFDGRIHFDYNWFDGAYNAQAEGRSGSDLFARRIRTGIDSELGDWEHSLILDFSENTAEIIIARVRYTGLSNGVKLQFGKLREDISLNALTSSNDTGLIERSSLADTFSPYFRWGAAAYQHHKDSGLRWAFGVYKNDAFGATGKDEDGALTLSYTGRLTWALANEKQIWHMGFWHSEREMGGNQLSAKLARGEIRRTNTRLLDYAVGGEVAELDSLSQSGLEFAFQHQSMTVEAEYARRTLDTLLDTNPLDDSVQQGYHLSLSYFPGGEVRPYHAGNALFNQPKNIRNAWELMARVSRMDASTETQGTDVLSYTVGTSYYFNPYVKFMGNLVFSEVSGPGQFEMTGNENTGKGVSARLHYAF